jgi:hypothetical protein
MVPAGLGPTNSVSDQVGSMTEQFKKITDAIEKINLEKANVQVTSSPQSDDVEQIFYNIKCSNDLYVRTFKNKYSIAFNYMYTLFKL